MNLKFSLLLFISFISIATPEDRSTLFSTGNPETTEGYLIYASETGGFSLSDRFTISNTYGLSSFGVFLGLQSDEATAIVQIRDDVENMPGNVLHEESFALNSANPLGQMYSIPIYDDCITLTQGNYWLTVMAADTSSQIIWLYAPSSAFPISSSEDNGESWTPVTIGTPGSATVGGDMIFYPEDLFPGDMNDDFLIDVTDIVAVVGLILSGEDLTSDQIDEADMNLDNDLDVLDVVMMVNVILNGLENPVVDFQLEDINDNSPTFGQMVGPFLYEGEVSAYYFGKAG